MDIVRVPRTDPAYNSHGYLTKVPEGAIRPFIEQYTEPGDTVLDPFAGSGMTGVAAYMTGRHAKLSDISILGKHIGSNLVNFVPSDELLRAAEHVVRRAQKKVQRFYRTRCSGCSELTSFGKFTWSYVYACDSCDERLVYYELLKANDWRAPSKCPGCGASFQKRTARRIDETPVLVSYSCDHCGNKGERAPTPEDLESIASALRSRRRRSIPSLVISADREMFRRSALGRSGHTETASFFSSRNALALTHLHEAISAEEADSVRSKLLFAFTAILPRASKRYQWHHKRPLNAQNQTYYIAAVFYEWNVFDLFDRKVKAAIRSDRYIHNVAGGSMFQSGSQVEYSTASADSLKHIPDESIDYVFTDPPFGSNMFYSDMSLFQEAWLGSTTDHRREAVIHTAASKQGESAARYEEVLSGTLRECWRVLKPGGRASIVFSNSRGEVWAMLQRAIQNSGFDFEPNGITLLDKGQRSVKGLASGTEGVVTADLVLTLVRKTRRVKNSVKSPESPVSELVASLLAGVDPESVPTPSHAYLRIIRSATERHVSLEGLHLSDVLTALNGLGYAVDRASGRLVKHPD